MIVWGPTMGISPKVVGGVAILGGIGWIAAAIVFYSPPAWFRIGADSHPSPPPAPIAIGSSSASVPDDRCEIHMPGGQGAWIARDDRSYDEMLDAQNASSDERLNELIADRKVIRVFNGTELRLIRKSFLSRYVRVLSGSDAGFEGWVQREFVRPSLPPMGQR